MSAQPATARPRGRRLTAGVALAALLTVLATGPFALFTTGYAQDIALRGLYLAVLCGTWSFLSGVAGQFSFAHAAIGGLAGYAGAIWSAQLADAGWVAGWAPSIAVGTLAGTLVAMLLGLLLQRLAGSYLALFTIAFAEVARLVVVAESQVTGGRLSLAVRPQLPGSGAAHYYIMLALLVAVLALVAWLLRTRVGLNLQAMREDAEAAAAMGVNVRAHKLLALSLAGALAALGGSVYFHTVDRLAPENLDLLLMSQVIAFTVIGGLERPLAAAASGLLLTLLLENLRTIDLDANQVLLLALALAVIPLAVAAVRVWRALRRHGRGPLLTAAAAAWPWALPGLLLAAWWLHAPAPLPAGGAAGGVGWLTLVVAVGLLVRAGSVARRRVPQAGGASAAVLVAACGLLAGGKLYTFLEVDLELGVWRLAVFGALLALTLRFAPNGLFTPLLDFFAGRGALRALAVAHRNQPEPGAGAAEEPPGPAEEAGEGGRDAVPTGAPVPPSGDAAERAGDRSGEVRQ